MSPKFYPMVYYLKEKDLGMRRFDSQIHKTRDGLALLELSPLIHGAGYTYGGTILNVPKKFQRELAAKGQLSEKPHSVSSADMVLLATRPALDDDEEDDERPLLRSDGCIEKAAFAALRRIFETCDRANVSLSPEVMLDECHEYLRRIQFRQNQGGRIRFFDTPTGEVEPADPQRTVGYVVGVPQLATEKTRLTVVFGMGGTETLWLCHLLRTHLANEFHRVLTTPEPRLSLIPFSVPAYVPFQLLECDPDGMRAEVVTAKLRY